MMFNKDMVSSVNVTPSGKVRVIEDELFTVISFDLFLIDTESHYVRHRVYRRGPVLCDVSDGYGVVSECPYSPTLRACVTEDQFFAMISKDSMLSANVTQATVYRFDGHDRYDVISESHSGSALHGVWLRTSSLPWR